MGRHYNCTCLNDEWDNYAWPTNRESTKLLKQWHASEERRHRRGGRPPLGQVQQPNKWLAVIISDNTAGVRFRTAANSVSAAGFAVRHIQAATPSNYKGKREMVYELFGMTEHPPIMISMTAFEIALLISHKRALRAIALSGYDWGGVFEDDSYLHEAVPPAHARSLLAASFAAADAARQVAPLLYTGICHPQCKSDVVAGDDQVLAGGLPEPLLRVGRCHGFCTHAYAVSRTRAATFFDDVFNCRNGSSGCGTDCELFPCFMDWAMMRYFQRGGEAWVVGGGLKSQWVERHRGLFIQNRSAALGNDVKRSGLAKKFTWGGNDTAAVDEQGCAQGVEVVDPPMRGTNATANATATPLRKLLVTIEWKGRLGNLMFEAAMLAGLVQRLRQVVPDTEAVTFGLPSSLSVPTAEMFEQFSMSQLVRLEQSGRTGFDELYDKQLAGCEACKLGVQEHFANRCDHNLIHRLMAWAASPPQGCRLGLIKLDGYFQCFWYFEGVSRTPTFLRSKVFAPAPTSGPTRSKAQDIIASVRQQLPAEQGWKLVGVQVRLGDKANLAYFSSLYAATTWDYYRAGMRELSMLLRKKSGATGVAFVVTAGGTMEGNANDIADARQNLSAPDGDRVFFSSGETPYVDLEVLRSCNALVIGPSSFGWWAAYLARLPRGHVMAPRHLFNKRLPRNHMFVRGYRRNDYYPSDWRLLENDGRLVANDEFAAPPPPPPPPPPSSKKLQPFHGYRSSTPSCPGGSQRRCYLRIDGVCPGYSRPQYRSWWLAAGGAGLRGAGAIPQQVCIQRQRTWQATCGRGVKVEMHYCH